MKSIEEKAELWDYYQDLVKSSGFDGFTDLLAENKRLQAIIDAANAQQSPAVAVPDGWILVPKMLTGKMYDAIVRVADNRDFISWPANIWESACDASPNPPTSKLLRITEQDAREIEDFLVEDYKREYVGQGIEAWLRSACRELLTKLNNRA